MKKNKKERKFYYDKLTTSAEQQKNIDKIVNDVILSDDYPYLKQILGWFNRGLFPVLKGFIRTYDSLRKAEIDPYIVVDNQVYRYIYIEHLIEATGVHRNNKRKKDKQFNRKGVWSTKINILCVLGLINKLDTSNIKDSYKVRKSREKRNEMIKEKSLDESKSKYVKNVNYFAIPKYNDEVFSVADKRAKKLYENGYKQSTFSKSIVIETFGQEFADNIFLDKRNKTSAELGRESLVFLTIARQVKERGYTTKNDVLYELLFQIDIFENKPYEVLKNVKQKKYIFLSNLFNSLLFHIKKMYDYKPLSKVQKQKLGIKEDSKKWYIIPKKEERT
jgi:hypothetical protein